MTDPLIIVSEVVGAANGAASKANAGKFTGLGCLDPKGCGRTRVTSPLLRTAAPIFTNE